MRASDSSPKESEIKLIATPAMLKSLLGDPRLAGPQDDISLTATYFDTKSGRLSNAQALLRVRESGSGREMTFKRPATGRSVLAREEWTVPLTGAALNIALFPAPARQLLERMAEGESLAPVCTVRVKRTTRRVRRGASTIEVCFDSGAITAGSLRTKVCELELELLEGSLADLLRLVLELPIGRKLAWSVRSKGERGYDLAFGRRTRVVRADPVPLDAEIDQALAFQAIAWDCLKQLVANYPIVVASGDADAIHQCRVAIRRWRAAFNLFGDIVADEQAPIIKAGLKAVADGLGSARDLHVQIKALGGQSNMSVADPGELLGQMAALETIAVRDAQKRLATPEFQRLLLQTALWIEDGPWLRRNDQNQAQPIGTFAPRVMARRLDKLRKFPRHLNAMSDAKRHRLRIAVKKLRYAVDFFKPISRNAKLKHLKRLEKILTRLQDILGELNDTAIAAARGEGWFAGLDTITAARMRANLDEWVDYRRKAQRALLAGADRAFADLRKISAD